MTPFDKAVKNFTPCKDAHSAFVYEDEDGVNEEPSYWCYSPLLPSSYTEVTRMAIFFGENRINNAKDPEGWLQWLMNDSGVADAFTTKDASVGLSEGVRMNLEADAGIVAGALLTMRSAFEYEYWAWGHLVKLGIDPVDAYFLSHRVGIVDYGGTLVFERVSHNATEHRLFTNTDSFDVCSFKKYEPVGESYLECEDYVDSTRICVFGSEGHSEVFSAKDPILGVSPEEIEINNPFSGICKAEKVLFNKKNAEIMLKTAKGE